MLEIQIIVRDDETEVHRNGENATNGQILFAIKALDGVKKKLMEALRHDINEITENEKEANDVIENALKNIEFEGEIN